MLAIIEKPNSQEVKAFVEQYVPGYKYKPELQLPGYIRREGRVFSLKEFQKLPNGSQLLAEYEQRT